MLFWRWYMGMGQNLQEQPIWGMNLLMLLNLWDYIPTLMWTAHICIHQNIQYLIIYLVVYLHLFIYMFISICLFTSLHIMDNYIQNCIYTYPYIHIYIYNPSLYRISIPISNHLTSTSISPKHISTFIHPYIRIYIHVHSHMEKMNKHIYTYNSYVHPYCGWRKSCTS